MPHQALELFLEMMIVERSAAVNTLEAYKRDLAEFIIYISGKKLEICPDSVRAYVRLLSAGGLSSKTIARKISALRQFYQFLYNENFLDNKEVLLLESPKQQRSLPKYLSISEVDRLIRAAIDDQSIPGFRLAALLEILYASGLRVSELVSLKHADLQYDRATGSLKPFLLIRGKGNKERLVVLNNSASLAIGNYLPGRAEILAQAEIDSIWLFPSDSKDGHLTRQRFGQLLKELSLKAGLDPQKVSPHVLRHSFASHLLENGGDLRVIQELLGHADISTTQIYTHIQSKKLKEIIDVHHPLAKMNLI